MCCFKILSNAGITYLFFSVILNYCLKIIFNFGIKLKLILKNTISDVGTNTVKRFNMKGQHASICYYMLQRLNIKEMSIFKFFFINNNLFLFNNNFYRCFQTKTNDLFYFEE